jgi:hypothetical protein
MIVNRDGRFVCPTVTGPFGRGMSGLVASATPACAEDAPKLNPMNMVSSTASPGTIRRRRDDRVRIML